MNDKSKIINKIIDNAKTKSKEIIDLANAEKSEILKKAKQEAKEYRLKTLPNSNELLDSLVEKGRILSNLEAKKIILSKKKEIIDEVFDLVVQDFKTKKSEKEYSLLVENMIKENAEDGDLIQFSSMDKAIFNDKFIQSLSKKFNLKLKLNQDYGKFKGGVLITNKNCDKNLTLEVELSSMRSLIESNIANTIFGD